MTNAARMNIQQMS